MKAFEVWGGDGFDGHADWHVYQDLHRTDQDMLPMGRSDTNHEEYMLLKVIMSARSICSHGASCALTVEVLQSPHGNVLISVQ